MKRKMQVGLVGGGVLLPCISIFQPKPFIALMPYFDKEVSCLSGHACQHSENKLFRL